MPWNLIRPYLIGGGVALIFFLIVAAYVGGRMDGKSSTEIKVVKQQVKTLEKVAKQNGKIDHETPFNGSKSDALSWLQQHTSKAN